MSNAHSWISWIPNCLSLSRIPLAFLFFSDSLLLRFLALFFAGCTDAADGFLARKLKVNSSWGALLDPLADKVFALIAFLTLWNEGALHLPELAALFTREMALIAFALFLMMKGEWKTFRIHAILSGKILTMLQGTILLFLLFHLPVSPYAYVLSSLLGLMTFIELFYERLKKRSLIEVKTE